MDEKEPKKMAKNGRKKRLRVTFHRKMEERKLYLDELNEIRKEKYKKKYKEIKRTIGPSWYQVLSHDQQKLLQTVDASIHHDLLEGYPRRLFMILTTLGIYPLPNKMDLLTCMYLGREDPKMFFAHLYHFLFEEDFNEKRSFPYCLNGRIILTSIYYLGLENLMDLLKVSFAPTQVIPGVPGRERLPPRDKNLSPYLQKFKLVTYEPPQPKKRLPKPLPNLDHLNAPYEKEIPRPKPPPPPPPPPPPKKRLPQEFCEHMAGYIQIGPAVKLEPPPVPPKRPPKRLKASKMKLGETGKKQYGLAAIGFARPRRKPKKPRLREMKNKENCYFIIGVCKINNRPFYIIGGICVKPTTGDIIHGGHKLSQGEYVRIHGGVVAHDVAEKRKPCQCLETLQGEVMEYLKATKCRCGHFYDFGNEGMFPLNQPFYFEQPRRAAPMSFDYNAIYEIDSKLDHVKLEYEKVWDDDSMLQDDDADSETKKRKKAKKDRLLVKVPSDCLGPKPKLEHYLRCALRYLRRTNIAAQLPDLHLAPELREWMRRRIYGDYTKKQKEKYFKRSQEYWQYLSSFQDMGLGKCWPKKTDLYNDFRKVSTWKYKTQKQKKFKVYAEDYKAQIYKAHAHFNNLFWATMFDPKFPDRSFRQIFFCYLASSAGDLTLVHPYSTAESERRSLEMELKRMVCLAKGAADVDLGWK